LDNINPKIVVLLAGTNNLGNSIPAGGEDAKIEDITSGIQAILEIIRSKAPQSTIILTGILPRNDNTAFMPVINKINLNLSKLADGNTVRYLTINDKLADSNGKLFDGMMNSDKLHPAAKAYQVWADALKPIFHALLGPPAKEDHAPPPTGDPSSTAFQGQGRNPSSFGGVCRQKSNATGFADREPANYREVEVLRSAGYLLGRMQVWVPAAASDIDPCELERSCLIEGTSSGSLLPIISMMQATDAREGNQTRGLIRLGRNRSHRRCVFLQRVVDSVSVIIRDVIPDQTA
jgi:hypothetical protein